MARLFLGLDLLAAWSQEFQSLLKAYSYQYEKVLLNWVAVLNDYLLFNSDSFIETLLREYRPLLDLASYANKIFSHKSPVTVNQDRELDNRRIMGAYLFVYLLFRIFP